MIFHLTCVKSVVMIGLSFAAMPVTALSGIDQSSVSMSIERPVICRISASGTAVGGGIVLSFCNCGTKPSVFLLTARHVVTYNKDYLNSLSVAYGKPFVGSSEYRLTGNTTGRWLTVDNRRLDVAWIELKKNEYPEWLEHFYAENILSQKVKKRNGMDVFAYTPFSNKRMPCVGSTIIPDIHFESNRSLKKVENIPVLLFNAPMSQNESGSPVFACNSYGDVDFLGVISAALNDQSCAIDAQLYITVIERNACGHDYVWLKNLHHLW